jgi:hypothetical protein
LGGGGGWGGMEKSANLIIKNVNYKNICQKIRIKNLKEKWLLLMNKNIK